MRAGLAAIGVAVVAISVAALADPREMSYRPIGGSVRVVDGDTLVVSGVRVRLAAIDAPESAQTCDRAGEVWACGRAATEALRALIAGSDVTCAKRDTDRYGRSVATCEANGVDLGEEMVRSGNAIDYRRYDRNCRYCAAEDEARAARRGIWATRFVEPWRWRRGER